MAGVPLDDFIKSLATEGVSDIHFKVGRPPLVRVHGTLVATTGPKLGTTELEMLARRVLGDKNLEKFQQTHECDTAFSLPGFARFRVSAYQQRSTTSISMRLIPFTVPDLDSLRVPPSVKSIAMAERGLVLVTGITGSGKSSTLAGMIHHINQSKPCNIITIEDPVEFLHKDILASVNQREVGIDTDNFANAFRGALRQDPDVILVGELRDLETMSIAIQAAETGHLVLSTIHTTDARETVGRFIDMFPPHQQSQTRLQLAANLRAVISQRLLERADNRGRVLAAEVMIVTAAVRACILDPARREELLQNMEKGRSQYGMQTFDQALIDLVEGGLISMDEALKNATSPNDLRLKVDIR
jgi:twitching motility protein PilT